MKNRAAYTLMELMVGMATGSMLLVGSASSIYIASQGFDADNSKIMDREKASVAADLILEDVGYALRFSERTSHAMTFTVPDRDGDSIPEIIRYAWSGTPGDPLTYELNGSLPVTIAEDVHNVNFAQLTRFMAAPIPIDSEETPGLLLVVGNSTSMSSQDAARQVLISSWGYSVTLIDDADSQANFDTALADSIVVYVSSEASAVAVGGKLNSTSVGVVNEQMDLIDDFGFASVGMTKLRDEINIEDNSHYIVSEYGVGLLTICTSAQTMQAAVGTSSPEIEVAAKIQNSGTAYDSALVTLETGAGTWDGGTSPGRRAKLPWGDSFFDVGSLNSDGQNIMRRTIEWAAGAGAAPTGGVILEEFTEAKLSSNGTSLTIDNPAGTADGNLLIVAVATDGNTVSSLSPPAGWNLISVEHENDRITFGVWWKLASNSESSNFQFTWSGGQEAYGWIMRFTGHDSATPIHASAVKSGQSSSPQCENVTTTVNDALILRLGGFDDDDINVDDPGINGHTEITMDESENGDGSASGGAAYSQLTTAGDSGTADFSLTNSEEYRTVTIAIAPEPQP